MSFAEDTYSVLMELSEPDREQVLQDIPRWKEVTSRSHLSQEQSFIDLFTNRQEFRSLIRFRSTQIANRHLTQKLDIIESGRLWFFVNTLHLSCAHIGPGLYIEHGQSTIVFAEKIGRNFWVNQNVTIGSGRDGIPIIGDDVFVRTNAIVIGKVHIGNQTKIGAGAVVTFDVPPSSTVVPAASRIISRDTEVRVNPQK